MGHTSSPQADWVLSGPNTQPPAIALCCCLGLHPPLTAACLPASSCGLLHMRAPSPAPAAAAAGVAAAACRLCCVHAPCAHCERVRPEAGRHPGGVPGRPRPWVSPALRGVLCAGAGAARVLCRCASGVSLQAPCALELACKGRGGAVEGCCGGADLGLAGHTHHASVTHARMWC